MAISIVSCSSLFFLLAFTVAAVLGSECCDSYYDIWGSYNSAKFCSQYCCGSSRYLYCCTSSSLRASSLYINYTCSEYWWSNNVWIYAIFAIVGLTLFIAFICLIMKCCTPNGHGGTVVAAHTSPVVHQISTTNTSHQVYPTPGYYGYQPGPQPPPTYGMNYGGNPGVSDPAYPPLPGAAQTSKQSPAS